MKTTFKIINHSSKAWNEAVKLREEILRQPLGSVFTPEELEEERGHIQIVGFIDNKVVSTAVLVPENHRLKMQRVVVTNKLRNVNIGSNMMAYCEGYAKTNDFKTIYCHARDSAVNFYLKNGYLGVGEYFDEDGIPHLKMIKHLL